MRELNVYDADHLSDIDYALACLAIAKREQYSGPRIGDIVRAKPGLLIGASEAEHYRIALLYKDRNSCQLGGFAAPNIDISGFSSYSGCLSYPVNMANMVEVGHARAPFWLFSENMAGAHRGREFTARVRVYQLRDV